MTTPLRTLKLILLSLLCVCITACGVVEDGGGGDGDDTNSASSGDTNASSSGDTSVSGDTNASGDTSSSGGDTSSSGDTSGGDTSEPPPEEGRCYDDGHCDGDMGEYCRQAVSDGACGACFSDATPCDSDGACAGNPDGEICDERPRCLCEPGPVCTTGCTDDSECSVDEVCQADGHCAPQSCVDEPCESTFICDGESSVCMPRTCGGHGDCAEGDVCVTGRCQTEAGLCDLPVP